VDINNIDPDNENIYTTYYMISDESSIPFYSTSNGYKKKTLTSSEMRKPINKV